MQRRHHRRAGRQTIIDDDHDAPLRIDRWPSQRIQRAPRFQSIHRRGFSCANHAASPPDGSIGHTTSRALVDRADRVFLIPLRTQLVHERHPELAVQFVGNQRAHRHRAARNRQHQRILATIAGERLRELARRIETIIENHGFPFSAAAAAVRS